jgi:F0F1-type ATP synthase assembly protein I
MEDGPSDRERRTEDGEPKGLSNLAASYQKAAPYMAASTALVASVGVFAGLGYWLDQKLEHGTPWLFIVGAVVGMAGGFISFFKTVLGASRKK